MAETNAFRKTVEGVPLGQLTVGEILELRNSGRGHDDLLTFADSPSDDGTVATRDRGSESYQFVYFFSDEALRWSPNALGPTFFGVFFDVYLSKALKRPKDEIKRLRQEQRIIRLMRGVPGQELGCDEPHLKFQAANLARCVRVMLLLASDQIDFWRQDQTLFDLPWV